ncbi:MAG: hypothetical protein KAI17_08790 [Thiotrichaceae bacterium]|nr:hypothetical protein [Thiotrichaceae bacterium]
MSAITLNDFATVIGLLVGGAGFALGVLNYFRDKAKVIVELNWDLSVTEGTEYDSNKLWGLVNVTNIGRRPIYISHTALKLPKGYDHSHLVLMEGVKGVKLTEGDPSQTFMVDQTGMEVYAKDWKKIIAQVNDSSGKTWKSSKRKNKKKPSWAE